MKLAFYKAKKGNWQDKIVSWWTRPNFWKFWESGLYSHVEVLFENGYCISASPRDGGVRAKVIGDIYVSGNWTIYDIVHGQAEGDTYYKKLLSREIGKKYDWICIFFSCLFPFQIQDPKRWTCSELVSNRIFGSLLPHKTSPNDLNDFVQKFYKIVEY